MFHLVNNYDYDRYGDYWECSRAAAEQRYICHVHRETAPFTKIKYAPISVKKKASNATNHI